MIANKILVCLLFSLATMVATAAEIVIINGDPAGVGLNDPTPATPIAGNTGTTLGEQRLQVIARAATIWAANLDSDVPITIRAQTASQPCSPTGAVLASAGANAVHANFTNAPIGQIWYHAALANSLAGEDLRPDTHDINTTFNLNLDEDPLCLGGNGWYYGLDNNQGNQTDLLATLLHEFGHGLGFSNFINETSGQLFNGRGDIYANYTFDLEAGSNWNDMTTAERVASAINDPDVVWTGPVVLDALSDFLAPLSEVTVNQPLDIAGTEAGQPASFGPPIPSQGISGTVVLAIDAVAPVNDGCSALVNGAELAGNIALIDRGECFFADKVLAAQNAGAIAVLIANNVADGLPPMGGDGPSVTIPSIGISQALGDAIKDYLPGVSVELGISSSEFVGTNQGFPRLHAPNPVAQGSSISHWSTALTPSLLMEPSITPDLTDDVDMTLAHFEDLGWRLISCTPVADGTQTLESTVCTGDTIEFTVEASGDDVTYQWLADGVPLPGETGATLTLTDLETGDAGTYVCQITNGCNDEVTSDSFVLAVDEASYATDRLPLWLQNSDNPCRDLDGNGVIEITDLVGLVSNTAL